MNLTYDVIIKRTPYGLIASVPDLDLRIIHNDKELNDCLAQHSVMSLNDFLELLLRHISIHPQQQDRRRNLLAR